MKKILIIFLIVAGVQSLAFSQQPKEKITLEQLLNERDSVSLRRYLDTLRQMEAKWAFDLLGHFQLIADNPSARPLILEKDQNTLKNDISRLAKSNKESDLLTLVTYYSVANQESKADSIKKTLPKRFPIGFTAFNIGMEEIFNEHNGAVNEILYQKFVKRFERNPKLKDHPYFDYVKYYVALSYVTSQPNKMMQWISKIKDPKYRANAYWYGASELESRGNTKDAEPLVRKSIEEFTLQKRTQSDDYFSATEAAATVLLGNRKYDEALAFFQIFKNKYKLTPDESNVYANLLAGTKKYKEAYPLMEDAIRTGEASPLIKERFKEAYQTVKGDTSGYSQHLDTLIGEFQNDVKNKVLKDMVNDPAFRFALKTPDGKTVNLDDLKGKVVILDFWATWCGPCKASFPKMQKAVNAYKNDPDVIFLFVHTLENSANPTSEAVNYLTANHYDFTLLMDLKDSITRKNLAATGFGLKGIPTKIVIDKSGNIRFRTVGNRAGEDLFMAEIKAMIELAKKNS